MCESDGLRDLYPAPDRAEIDWKEGYVIINGSAVEL